MAAGSPGTGSISAVVVSRLPRLVCWNARVAFRGRGGSPAFATSGSHRADTADAPYLMVTSGVMVRQISVDSFELLRPLLRKRYAWKCRLRTRCKGTGCTACCGCGYVVESYCGFDGDAVRGRLADAMFSRTEKGSCAGQPSVSSRSSKSMRREHRPVNPGCGMSRFGVGRTGGG